MKALKDSQWKWSISAKLSMMILFMISISLFISGYINVTFTESFVKTEVENQLSVKNEAIVRQIDAVFNEKATVVRQLGMNRQVEKYLKTAKMRDEALTNPEYGEVLAVLNQIFNSDKAFSLVYVVSEGGSFDIGNHGHLTGTDFEVTKRPWHEAAVKAKDIVFTAPYVDYTSGKLVISIFHPMRDGDDLLGFVAVDMFLDSLPEMMEFYKYGQIGYSFLVSQDGTILYHPTKEYVLRRNITEMEGDLGKIGRKIVAGQKGVQLAHISGEEEYVSYSRAESVNWTVGIAIPSHEIIGGVKKLSNNLLLCLTVSGVLLVVCIYFLLRFMLRPIPHVSEAIKRISKGDLTTRLMVKSKDEIGQVMASLNKMAEQLDRQNKEIKSQRDAIQRAGTEMILALAQAIEIRDANTAGHCKRVADIAFQIGQHMELDHLELLHLYWAGLLHDIGKIGIPEHILNKEGKLTEEELFIMQQHPALGDRILSNTDYSKYIHKGVRHHHERLDGKGYPDQLKGDEIALQAKIIAISDVWDALTSDRPYRKALSYQEAVSMMKKGEGTQFDSVVLKAFFHIISPVSYRANVSNF